MDRRTKIALIGGIALFALVLLWFLKPSDSKPEQGKNNPNQTKAPSFVSSSWDDKYGLESKDPNGLFIFNFLVGANQKKGKTIGRIDSPEQLDSLLTNGKSSFLFIGDEFILQQKEIDQLIQSVEKGSSVFVSSYTIDEKFMAELLKDYKITFDYSKQVQLRDHKNKQYLLSYVYQNDTIANSWYGFENYEADNRFKVESSLFNTQMTSVLRFDLGKGHIFINHTPELFVNYQLKSKDGFEVSKNLIATFNPYSDAYWMEIARFKEYDESWDEEESGEDNSLLQFIFQNPYLFQAMMWTLVGVLLFLFFRTKRMRPVVPPLSPKKNMTLSFVDAISSIYFAKRNPFALLQVQRKNFYETIYRHFLVDLSRKERERELITLAEKSEYPINDLKQLIAKMEVSNELGVDDQYNVDIAKAQRSFYLHAGIVSEKVLSRIAGVDHQFHRSVIFSSLILIAGLMSFIAGMYLLIHSYGIGIVFWPLAILLISWGILRLSKPLISISSATFKYHPLVGKTRVYHMDELKQMENDPGGFKFVFNDKRPIVIRYAQLSSLDSKQIKKIIENQEKLRL